MRRPANKSTEAIKNIRRAYEANDVADEKVYENALITFSRLGAWTDEHALVLTQQAIKPKSRQADTTLQQCIAKAYKGLEESLRQALHHVSRTTCS